jgi:hypothetical protein
VDDDHDNPSISDCPVGRDVTNSIGVKEKDCVSPLGNAAWFALCQPMDFFAHCQYPEMFEVRITQRCLRSGSCCIFLQFVMVCLVTGWTTPKQCSLMLMMGLVHCESVASLRASRVIM